MASIYKRNGKWRVEIRKIGSKGIHKSFIVKDEAIRFARETEVKIEQGLYQEGMRIVNQPLKKKGYRMPTEAEFEFFHRAGSSSMFNHGSDIRITDRFSFYVANSKDQAWRFTDWQAQGLPRCRAPTRCPAAKAFHHRPSRSVVDPNQQGHFRGKD